MKKNLLVLLFISIFHFSFAQSKVVELLPNKQLLEYRFLENDGVFFQFGKIAELLTNPLDKRMLLYSPQLEKVNDYDLTKIGSKLEGITTPTGKLSGFYRKKGYEISDVNSHYFKSSGEQTIIEAKNNIGSLEEVIKVFNTDTYQIYFGKQKKRKFKSIIAGTEYNDLYFYRTDVKTGATKLVKIDFPTQSFPNAKMFYQYQSHTNDKVFFILNELHNEKKKNVCNLVSFNYDGKLIDNVSFTMELQSDLTYSQYSNGSNENWIFEGFKNNSIVKKPTDGAVLKLMISPDQKSFYAYGLLNIKLEKYKYDVEDGFYMYKFDFNGNLLWKIEKSQRSKEEVQKNYYVGEPFQLMFLNNNTLGFWCKHFFSDDTVFYKINPEKGEVIESKTNTILGSRDLEFLRKKGLAGLEESKLYIANKYSDKIRMDMNTIYALNFNPAVEKYISNKEGVKFVGHLFENGIYLIEENLKETKYQLLKFDW